MGWRLPGAPAFTLDTKEEEVAARGRASTLGPNVLSTSCRVLAEVGGADRSGPTPGQRSAKAWEPGSSWLHEADGLTGQ